MPRSAFLEGAREAGGTKTCTGALAKQKTAGPQGAASLSLAVLENDGRKREGAIDSEARWVRGTREMDGRQQQAEIVERRCKQNERKGDGYTRTVSRSCRDAVSFAATPTIGRGRAAYWLPAAGVPAFRIEVAAAKMRAAL